MARSSSRDAEPWPRTRLVLAAAALTAVVLARPALALFAEDTLRAHGDQAVLVVQRVAFALSLALTAAFAFARTLGTPAFIRRFVLPATARDLAVLRIAVGTVTALMLAFEPIPHTAELPAGLYAPVGLMGALEGLPFFEALRRSPAALSVFWGTGILACMLAALGLGAQRSALVGSVIALVCGGILRSYTRVFHLGLLPALLLFVLAFTPCGDALSLDAARGARARGDASTYAYGRFVVLANVGIAYASAGLSKLLRGGSAWWDARNMHRMLFESSLEEMAFDFDVPLRVDMPDFVVAGMGLAAVAIELAMPLILIRGLRGRFLLPLAAIGMHVGILLCQNILFPDVLALDAVLLCILLSERTSAQPTSIVVPRSAPLLVGIPLFVALAGIEAYPLTAWPMFSHADTRGVATYHTLRAETDAGPVALDMQRCYPSLHDTRHRDLMRFAFSGPRRDAAREAFVRCALSQPSSSPIRHVVVERRAYDFVHNRRDPERGHVVARLALPVIPSLVALGSKP